MKTPRSDIFTQIRDADEKLTLLGDLVKSGKELILKGLDPSCEIFRALPKQVSKTKLLCQLSSPMNETQHKGAIVQFNAGEEKYLSQVGLEIDKSSITLDFSSLIYRVQRRSDFRLKIPASFQGQIVIRDNTKQIISKLLDLSAGGCRVETDLNFTTGPGKTYKGLLKTAGRKDIPLTLEVRHEQDIHSAPPHLTIGFQFINHDEVSKNRMAALVMDLYREFFSSRK